MAKLKQTRRVSSQKGQQGQLRIIAGKWRGRKLAFPDIADLRPTPDRVRETIFNWLQPYIGGAACLDLFAGSGALGFEALSRGAEQVTLVESQAEAINQLSQNANNLSAEGVDIKHMNAQQYIKQCQKQFDVIFIDPPYQANLWSEITELLIENQVLAEQALIYLECPSHDAFPSLPDHFQILKDKKAGDVRYCLLTYQLGGKK